MGALGRRGAEVPERAYGYGGRGDRGRGDVRRRHRRGLARACRSAADGTESAAVGGANHIVARTLAATPSVDAAFATPASAARGAGLVGRDVRGSAGNPQGNPLLAHRASVSADLAKLVERGPPSSRLRRLRHPRVLPSGRRERRGSTPWGWQRRRCAGAPSRRRNRNRADDRGDVHHRRLNYRRHRRHH